MEGRRLSSNHEKVDKYLIRCPQCDRYSDSIKIFHFPIIIFLIVFFYVFKKTKAACPSCQRYNVGYYALINVPALHLLWPFVYIPLIIFYVVCTYIPGHSRDVQQTLSLRK